MRRIFDFFFLSHPFLVLVLRTGSLHIHPNHILNLCCPSIWEMKSLFDCNNSDRRIHYKISRISQDLPYIQSGFKVFLCLFIQFLIGKTELILNTTNKVRKIEIKLVLMMRSFESITLFLFNCYNWHELE